MWIILYTVGHDILTGDFALKSNASDILSGVIGEIYYYNHLWYLYAAVLLYAVTPFIKTIVDSKNGDRLLDYALIIWCVYSVIWRFIGDFCVRLQPSDYFNLDIMGGCLGYYILRYKIGTKELKIKNSINCGIYRCLYCYGSIVACGRG